MRAVDLQLGRLACSDSTRLCNSKSIPRHVARLPDRAVHLGVVHQKLNRTPVAGLFVNLGDFGAPHRMRAASAHFRSDQIATKQLAVDGQIEPDQFAIVLGQVKPNLDCPDMLAFSRSLLTDDAPIVQSRVKCADGW